MEIVKDLVNFAAKLDSEQLTTVASAVDAIASNFIKTAQTVGSQGYWIRNERCFKNCYRQKRASQPNKPAQEVWFNCHEEFQKSINNDGSKWDKYAGSTVLVKSASRDALDRRLVAKLDGQDTESALQGEIQRVAQIHIDLHTDASKKMFHIAESLHDYDEGLASEAAAIAEKIVKEAAPFQGLWNAVKSPFQQGAQWAKNVGKGIQNQYYQNQQQSYNDQAAKARQRADQATQNAGYYSQKLNPGGPSNPNPDVTTAPANQSPTAPAGSSARPASPAGSSARPASPTARPATTVPPVSNQKRPAAPSQTSPSTGGKYDSWLQKNVPQAFEKYKTLDQNQKQQADAAIAKKIEEMNKTYRDGVVQVLDGITPQSTGASTATQSTVAPASNAATGAGAATPGGYFASNKNKSLFRLS